jgi:hypothetical protein
MAPAEHEAVLGRVTSALDDASASPSAVKALQRALGTSVRKQRVRVSR